MSSHALAMVEPTSVARPAWEEKIEVIKQTVAVGATDAELDLFLYQARRTGLDPLLRQIHCVKRQGKAVIQVGIDGLRVIAERTERYAGSDPPVWEESGFKSGDNPRPDTASVTVWKLVGGQRVPFTATVRWEEFCPPAGQDFQWKKMPYHMLAKVAESHALRKAFPADTSGLYIREETDQAGFADGEVIDVVSHPVPPTRINAPGRTQTIETLNDQGAGEKTPHEAPSQSSDGNADEPADADDERTRFRKQFFAAAKERGITDKDKLKELSRLIFPGVESRASFTASMWADAVSWIEDTANAAALRPFQSRDWQAAIAGCHSMADLMQLAAALSQSGQGTDELRAAFKARKDEIEAARRLASHT